MSHPWEVGDHAARWDGYLIGPEFTVLRNKVGATTLEELRAAENDLLEFRLAELRASPVIVRRTYDLPHFRAIHRQLFQDVYEWAGDVRTVGLSKGEGDPFVPPLSMETPLAHVASRIQESERLRALPASALPGEFAYLYDYANFAHPFREGNGRVQREFFTHLAAESGHGLDWDRIDMGVLHGACHTARNDENIEPMVAIFESILTDDPE